MPAKSAAAANQADSAESFEQQLEALERLVEELESGDIPLEQALAAYERGLGHARACEQLLEQARSRIEALAEPAGAAPNGTPES